MDKNQNRTGRRLTYDELKAAEAAFQGWPVIDAWSEAAQIVYRGILVAKLKLKQEHGMPEPLPRPDSQNAAEAPGPDLQPGDIAESYRL
jgi:hypothetical protein